MISQKSIGCILNIKRLKYNKLKMIRNGSYFDDPEFLAQFPPNKDPLKLNVKLNLDIL